MKKEVSSYKICFAASSGGHLEQLMMLKPMMDKYQGVVVTEKTSYQSTKEVPTYNLLQINRREFLFLPKMFINAIKSVGILMREKPDAVICTGVLAMIPLCLLAKLMGKKLVYLESFAKVTSPTLSGKLLYRFADRFYVQWPQMLEIYPNAIYIGGIY